MSLFKSITASLVFIACGLAATAGFAADYPAPQRGSWVVKDFKFHTQEVLPELRLAYATVGAPTGEPVLVLHGTTGSAASMLSIWASSTCGW